MLLVACLLLISLTSLVQLSDVGRDLVAVVGRGEDCEWSAAEHLGDACGNFSCVILVHGEGPVVRVGASDNCASGVMRVIETNL